MRHFLTLALLALIPMMTQAQDSFYDFKMTTIDGNEFDFAKLKGKKVMLVNVASKCGLTGQYEQLQAVHEKYGSDQFMIIGFPANNFLSQEPGTDSEIITFCKKNYGVEFQMMSKISVKGKDIHPLYQWLTSKEKNGTQDSKVSWNFQKYLIGPNGKIEKVIAPRTLPDDEEVINWITQK